jgi:3-hydroxyacyl-CoA dehydrogenase
MSQLVIRQAAVLGAGVMGAQIAAHLVNARVPVILFDLPAKEGDKNGIALRAIEGLKKLSPAPLDSKEDAALIRAANYEEDLERLRGCDLVIEAIAERLDWKRDLYAKVAPFLGEQAIFATNTSGISITKLSQGFDAGLAARFCGVHFFNPPRYMRLVELIPTAATRPEVVDALETFITSTLGKGVVRAKDTPNFVANRIGVFSMLAAFHHTERLGLALDEVDALTGPKLGRPKSATYRLQDVVGLDTLVHTVRTMKEELPEDPWRAHFQAPGWLRALVDQGALGQKTGGGIFKKVGKDIQVLDPATGKYRPAGGTIAPEVEKLLAIKSPAERLAALRASAEPQAQFLWAIQRDVFHYAAVQLERVADNARDVDLAMRWGFGWSQGPFEAWQAAGWKAIADAIAADVAAGKAMSAAPLPRWVAERDGVHAAGGSWSAARRRLEPRSSLPAYRRQLYPQTVLGEAVEARGTTVWEGEGVRGWTHPLDPGILIASFKSKMHAIGDEVVDGVLELVARAERDHAGLVLWHEPPFAVGANLKQVAAACAAGRFDLLEGTTAKFQRASMALKHALVPTVAAVHGMALGGGCEFAMHSAHRVLALESQLGLVEAGVGLIPAGGGCKEFALQAAEIARRQVGNDPLYFLQNVFTPIATARVAQSGLEARELGFARESDDVVFHPDELLYVALRRARALAEAGWRAPMRGRRVAVAGRPGIATLEMGLVNMKEGGMISAHDYRVAKAAATALCGGDVEVGSLVDDEWLLAVERHEFLELLKTPETQARIAHMLETGKPLRN